MNGNTETIRQAPAPLYRDPVYDGAHDAEFVWNHLEQCWWLTYLQSRAASPLEQEPGMRWAFGTDIGLASTPDCGRTWVYRGIMKGLQFENSEKREGEKADLWCDTFWRPFVLWHEGEYHGFFTWRRGFHQEWDSFRHNIVHYTSDNLVNWRFKAIVWPGAYDACVHPMPGGKWLMWSAHKAEPLESQDLYNWAPISAKRFLGDILPREGCHVAKWKGFFWMVTDHEELIVHRSGDGGLTWQKQQSPFVVPASGSRPMDQFAACQGPILVQGDRAWLLYHTHYIRNSNNGVSSQLTSFDPRRSALQIAEVEFRDGWLHCNRDKSMKFELVPPSDDKYGELFASTRSNAAAPTVWQIAQQDIRQIALAEVARLNPGWSDPWEWRPYTNSATYFKSCRKNLRGKIEVFEVHFHSHGRNGVGLDYHFVIHAASGAIIEVKDHCGKELEPKQFSKPCVIHSHGLSP